eukprot:960977-Amphidinium_carterae.1
MAIETKCTQRIQSTVAAPVPLSMHHESKNAVSNTNDAHAPTHTHTKAMHARSKHCIELEDGYRAKQETKPECRMVAELSHQCHRCHPSEPEKRTNQMSTTNMHQSATSSRGHIWVFRFNAKGTKVTETNNKFKNWADEWGHQNL